MRSLKLYALIALLSCLPFITIFSSPELPHTSDGGVQIPRMGAYYKALKDVHIPVRWVGDLNYGYGLPLFNFIYHTPFLISSALISLNVGLIPTFKIVLALSFILSGIFMLGFTREFFSDDKTAFLITVFYQFTPYRLIEILVRGSVGSIYAYTFLPLTLWAIVLVWKKPTRSRIAFVSLASGMMIISHNALALLFFGCISLFLMIFRFNKSFALFVKQILPSIFGLIGGLCMSAFYWIPALFEHKYTYGDLFMKDLFRTSFPPLLNFFIPNPLDSANLRMSEISVNFGIFQTVVFCLGIILLVTRWQKLSPVSRKLFVFSVLLITVCVFFMSRMSIPIWEHVSFLRQFQFSWRFLGVVVLGTSLLSVSLLELRLFKKPFIFYGALILTIASTVFYWRPTQGWDTNVSDSQFWDYPLNTTYFGETDVIWSAGPAKKAPVSRIEVIDGNATVSNFHKITQLQTFTVESTTGGRLVSHTQYYPGWNVYVNGKKTEIQFQDPNWRGLITFDIPRGSNEIAIRFEETKLRKLANTVSIGSVFVLFIIFAHSVILRNSYPVMKQSRR